MWPLKALSVDISRNVAAHGSRRGAQHSVAWQGSLPDKIHGQPLVQRAVDLSGANVKFGAICRKKVGCLLEVILQRMREVL